MKPKTLTQRTDEVPGWDDVKPDDEWTAEDWDSESKRMFALIIDAANNARSPDQLIAQMAAFNVRKSAHLATIHAEDNIVKASELALLIQDWVEASGIRNQGILALSIGFVSSEENTEAGEDPQPPRIVFDPAKVSSTTGKAVRASGGGRGGRSTWVFNGTEYSTDAATDLASAELKDRRSSDAGGNNRGVFIRTGVIPEMFRTSQGAG